MPRTSSITATINIPHKAQRDWRVGLVTSILFLIVCLSWGTTWLSIKIAVESAPPLTSAGLRFLIAFPLFLVFAWVRKAPLFFPRENTRFFIFVTLGYFCAPYCLLNYGEMHVASGLTALIFSSMPVFILIFSALFLREKIYFSQLIGIAIGFGSLFMIVKTQGLHMDHAELLGVLTILCAAVMHALCYVITKRQGAHISVITFNTLPIGIAGLMLFGAGTFVEHPRLADITLRSWSALGYLGLAASVGGFIVYFLLLKRLSPVILSFVFIVFPVFAVVIGSWYEGLPLSKDLCVYSASLLIGFAITKLPVERLMAKDSRVSS